MTRGSNHSPIICYNCAKCWRFRHNEDRVCILEEFLLLLLLLLSRFSRVRLCATPETAAHQAPPSLGFSRQDHWSGLPFPSPGDLPNPGIELGSPTLQADTLPSEPPGKPRPNGTHTVKLFPELTASSCMCLICSDWFCSSTHHMDFRVY